MLALSTVEPIGLHLPGSLSDPLAAAQPPLTTAQHLFSRARACASQPCLAAFPSVLGLVENEGWKGGQKLPSEAE